MTVASYVKRHAWCPHRLDSAQRFERCLVVPLRAEPTDALEGHRRACGAGTLVIAVVNGRLGDDRTIAEKNAAVLEKLTGHRRPRHGAVWTEWTAGPLLVLDHASEGRRLGAREGVGSARRLGLDAAAQLFASGQLASPWVATSDADASTPADHFDAPDRGVARSHRFWHAAIGDDAIDEVTALYELWLRYYAAGLAWAGSPYAMLTIGSTMAVRLDAYAKVRGMPRRQAAEDFYFLNKLAKVGAVVVPATGRVILQPRVSSRVPFGTGRTTHDWLARRASREPITWLAPEGFARLRDALELLEKLAAGKPAQPHGALARALAAIGFSKAERSMQSAKGIDQRRRRLHEWLDAFRTLRLLHELRDAGISPVPWRRALQAPFMPAGDPDEPLWIGLRTDLERQLPSTAGVDDAW